MFGYPKDFPIVLKRMAHTPATANFLQSDPIPYAVYAALLVFDGTLSGTSPCLMSRDSRYEIATASSASYFEMSSSTVTSTTTQGHTAS